MSRFVKQTELGLKWTRCGWRLFKRDPWLLSGMGVCSAAVVLLPTFIPFIGTPLVGLLVPALLASFWVTLDRVAQQKKPAVAGAAAFKQSPRALLVAFQEESRLLQVVMISLYGLVTVVLADILLYLIAGGVWTAPNAGIARLALASLVAVVVYALIAASLIYTLPLALLEKAPLVPAMGRSLKISARCIAALIAPALLLLTPLLVGAAVSPVSVPLAYLAGFLAGAISVPVSAAALYCSYRTVLAPPTTAGKPVPPRERVRAA